MCARFTVLGDTPIAAAINGRVIKLSRGNTIWMRRCSWVFSIAALFSTAGPGPWRI
ncbi:MAG: hypothetical protein WA231_03195 [Methylocella sp.]